MNTKILAPILVIGVALMMGVAGGMAFFSDVESSTNNSLNSGTMDLYIGDDDETWHDGSAITTWSVTDMAPGESVTHTLQFKNVGSIGADYIILRFNNLEINDEENPEPEPDGSGTDWRDDIASQINVTYIAETNDHHGGWDEPAVSWFEGFFGDEEAPLTLRELNDHYIFFEDRDFGTKDFIYPDGGTARVKIELTFDNQAGNMYQGDTCTFDIGVKMTNNLPEDAVSAWD